MNFDCLKVKWTLIGSFWFSQRTYTFWSPAWDLNVRRFDARLEEGEEQLFPHLTHPEYPNAEVTVSSCRRASDTFDGTSVNSDVIGMTSNSNIAFDEGR